MLEKNVHPALMLRGGGVESTLGSWFASLSIVESWVVLREIAADFYTGFPTNEVIYQVSQSLARLEHLVATYIFPHRSL